MYLFPVYNEEEVAGRNGCLKNGEHVPAFVISGMYKFLEGISMYGLSPRGRAFPEREDSTPRVNPHGYTSELAITNLQKLQSWDKRKPHSPPPETYSHKHT